MLSSHLQSQKDSQWSIRALRFLLAGIVAGLRPVEWANVVASDNPDGSLSLTVQNAKATNGRANGPTRSVRIPPGVDRTIVEEHLYEITRFRSESPDEPFSKYVESARKSLWLANRKVLRDHHLHVTLYTGRHQFSANKKAEGLTKRELADLMGHESPETATEHYGRRKSGWGRTPATEQTVALAAARPSSR